jgi:hypothetical protein
VQHTDDIMRGQGTAAQRKFVPAKVEQRLLKRAARRVLQKEVTRAVEQIFSFHHAQAHVVGRALKDEDARLAEAIGVHVELFRLWSHLRGEALGRTKVESLLRPLLLLQ